MFHNLSSCYYLTQRGAQQNEQFLVCRDQHDNEAFSYILLISVVEFYKEMAVSLEYLVMDWKGLKAMQITAHNWQDIPSTKIEA